MYATNINDRKNLAFLNMKDTIRLILLVYTKNNIILN
jgi:hypothetical protein